MIKMTDTICHNLCQVYPDRRETFVNNANSYIEKLQALEDLESQL